MGCVRTEEKEQERDLYALRKKSRNWRSSAPRTKSGSNALMYLYILKDEVKGYRSTAKYDDSTLIGVRRTMQKRDSTEREIVLTPLDYSVVDYRKPEYDIDSTMTSVIQQHPSFTGGMMLPKRELRVQPDSKLSCCLIVEPDSFVADCHSGDGIVFFY